MILKTVVLDQVIDEGQELAENTGEVVPATFWTNVFDKSGANSIGDRLLFILHDLRQFS